MTKPLSSSSQLQLTIKEEFVLLALSKLPESYGTELMINISKHTSENVDIDCGTMYPILERLTRKSLIKFVRDGNDIEGERNGRKRKYYSITPLGIEVLERVQCCRDGILKGEFS